MNSDLKNKIALSLIQKGGEVSVILRKHCLDLKQNNKNIKQTNQAFEISKYGNESQLEGYVDAEFIDGTIYSWIFEVTWVKSSWLIEGSLRKSAPGGQQTVNEIPDNRPITFEALLEALIPAVTKLVSLSTN